MFHNLYPCWHFVKLVILKAGLPESPEELTKRITRGFIVELLNVVIINPIIQVGDNSQQQHWTHSCYQMLLCYLGTGIENQDRETMSNNRDDLFGHLTNPWLTWCS